MKIRHIYPVIWLGLIVFASLTPADKLPTIQLFEHADKLIHWAMYFGLSILLIPALLKEKNYTKSYSITLISAIFIGSIMEYFQAHLSGNRSAEFADFVANCIGVLTGCLFYQLFLRNKKLEKGVFRIG
jgi:VanZ family protein